MKRDGFVSGGTNYVTNSRLVETMMILKRKTRIHHETVVLDGKILVLRCSPNVFEKLAGATTTTVTLVTTFSPTIPSPLSDVKERKGSAV